MQQEVIICSPISNQNVGFFKQWPLSFPRLKQVVFLVTMGMGGFGDLRLTGVQDQKIIIWYIVTVNVKQCILSFGFEDLC